MTSWHESGTKIKCLGRISVWFGVATLLLCYPNLLPQLSLTSLRATTNVWSWLQIWFIWYLNEVKQWKINCDPENNTFDNNFSDFDQLCHRGIENLIFWWWFCWDWVNPCQTCQRVTMGDSHKYENQWKNVELYLTCSVELQLPVRFLADIFSTSFCQEEESQTTLRLFPHHPVQLILYTATS